MRLTTTAMGLGPLVRQRRREKNIEQAVAVFAAYSTTYAAWEELVLDMVIHACRNSLR